MSIAFHTLFTGPLETCTTLLHAKINLKWHFKVIRSTSLIIHVNFDPNEHLFFIIMSNLQQKTADHWATTIDITGS